MTSPSSVEPAFFELRNRRLFTLRIRPYGDIKGAILYVPPFAEEMNRCRALAADQARALAQQGFDCLLLDPTGTGDSSGNLADATWDIWQEDIEFAASWLESETGLPVTLWGFRLGALQVADLASRSPGRFPRLLFWQPIPDGKLFINQTLRLRIASMMLREGSAETTEQVRQRLAAGEVIEIAGYELTGALAAGIESRRIAKLDGLGGTAISWIEMFEDEDAAISVGSQRVIDTLRTLGCNVSAGAIQAPPMWQVHKRETAPALIAKTIALLTD